MNQIEIKGIVARQTNTGEADRIITILSEEYGKISAYARGARRSNSKFSASTGFLCYGEFQIIKKQKMNILTSSRAIKTFSDIACDIEKLTYATHFLDIARDIIQEEEPSPQILKLLLNSIYLLSKSEKESDLIALIYEARCLYESGLGPYVDACVVCNRPLEECTSFNFNEDGLTCDQHSKGCDIKVDEGTKKALQHLAKSPIESLFSFRISLKVKEQLKVIIKASLTKNLEKEYKRLDFLKKL